MTLQKEKINLAHITLTDNVQPRDISKNTQVVRMTNQRSD